MKKITEIKIWIGVTVTLIFCGAFLIALGFILVQLKLIHTSYMQWMSSVALALTSLGLASFAVVKTLQSEKRITDIEKKEIQKKLSMFQEENNSNIEFIDLLIKRKGNYFPPKLLEKKLKQSKGQKYKLTPAELKQIADGGLWIPKGAFSYNYALQVIELAHHLDNSFIEEVRNYIKIGIKLNIRKDSCHQWAIVRGILNPDETNNYYKALNNSKKVTDEMKEIIITQLEKHQLKN